eukprot:TRINITY_DN3827_c0_g1_i1.p1 TRINITY_DN3827_c0_g1~~TRINITY_DN3827_c0_g1_i1.p1  ORF type:complete len:946 (+),score=277.67 TRINITY_DN3827_c0_g1_i1:199-3036(+)
METKGKKGKTPKCIGTLLLRLLWTEGKKEEENDDELKSMEKGGHGIHSEPDKVDFDASILVAVSSSLRISWEESHGETLMKQCIETSITTSSGVLSGVNGLLKGDRVERVCNIPVVFTGCEELGEKELGIHSVDAELFDNGNNFFSCVVFESNVENCVDRVHTKPLTIAKLEFDDDMMVLHLEKIFQSSAFVVFVVDETRIMMANPVASVLTKYAVDELIGMDTTSLIQRINGDTHALTSLHDNVSLLICKDGTERVVEVFVSDFSSCGHTLHFQVIHDITDQWKVETHKMRLLSAMQESEFVAGVGSFDIAWGEEERIFLSDGLRKIVAVNLPESYGVEDTLMSFVVPQHAERVKSFLEFVKKSADRVRFKFQVQGVDGTHRIIRGTARSQFDANGLLKRTCAVMRDITDEVDTERELTMTMRRYQCFMENIRDGILIVDRHGTIKEANDILCMTLGMGRSEVIGNPLWTVVSKDGPNLSIDRRQKGVIRLLKSLPPAAEISLQHKNGSTLPMAVHVTCLEHEKDTVLLVLQDLTEQKSHEEKLATLSRMLLKAQKMEAIGRLAGGVAHDFNNILTAIMGNANMAETELPELHPSRPYLSEIYVASKRAAELTGQLLAISRRQIIQPKIISPNMLISQLQLLLERTIGPDVELRTELSPNVGCIFADPGQIEQAILNLVVNARDAMPNGGLITIRTSETDGDVRKSLSSSEADQSLKDGLVLPDRFTHVVIEVEDTGHGMEPSVIEKIFEPFFTTKPEGKGTGLGLSTVYGIVKQHDGHIQIDSKVGRGTTFRLIFAKKEGVSDFSRRRSVLPPQARKGKERIFFVDDDPIVRKVGIQTVKRRGYVVDFAENGLEAMEKMKGKELSIDLLLTDIVMPGMRGTELAKIVMAKNPLLRVLFTSGYSDGGDGLEEMDQERVHFIGKPYTPTALATKIREVLDQALYQ